MNTLYQEEIVLHFQHPQNKGKPEKFDLTYHKVNSFCGDEITVYLKKEQNKIVQINYDVKGCAICTASASILSESLKDKNIKEILELNSSDVLAILKIELTPARLKCALLPLEAIQQALLRISP